MYPEDESRRGLVSYLHEVLPRYLDCLAKGKHFQDIKSIQLLVSNNEENEKSQNELPAATNEKDRLRRLDGKENVTAPLLLLSFCEENLDKIFSNKHLLASVREVYVMINDDLAIISQLCKRSNEFKNDSKSSFKRIRRKMISANTSSSNNHAASTNESLSVSEIVFGLLNDLLIWINLRIVYIDAINELKQEMGGSYILSNNYLLVSNINKALSSADLLYTDKLLLLIDDTVHSLDIILAFVMCKTSLFSSNYVNFVTDIFKFQQLRQQTRPITTQLKDDNFNTWIASCSGWLVSVQSLFFEANVGVMRDHVQKVPPHMISRAIMDALRSKIIENKIINLVSSYCSNANASGISLLLVNNGYNMDSKTYKAPSQKYWTYKIDHSMTRVPMSNSTGVNGKSGPYWFPSYVFAIPNMRMGVIDDVMRCILNPVEIVPPEILNSVEYVWMTSHWSMVDMLLQNRYSKQAGTGGACNRFVTNEKPVLFAAPDSTTIVGTFPLYIVDSKVITSIVVAVNSGSSSNDADNASKPQIHALLREIYTVFVTCMSV